jgi:phage shock protein E
MKASSRALLSLWVLLTLISCSKYGPEQQQAWLLIDNGAQLIDVRTKEEFDQGHLDHAINIEYENIPMLVKHIGEDKNRSVVLYCRSGRRADVAISELSKLGYTDVFNGEGIIAMEAALNDKLKLN